eukprot:ANDGO_02443.mRNA.1 hypothetical protein
MNAFAILHGLFLSIGDYVVSTIVQPASRVSAASLTTADSPSPAQIQQFFSQSSVSNPFHLVLRILSKVDNELFVGSVEVQPWNAFPNFAESVQKGLQTASETTLERSTLFSEPFQVMNVTIGKSWPRKQQLELKCALRKPEDPLTFRVMRDITLSLFQTFQIAQLQGFSPVGASGSFPGSGSVSSGTTASFSSSLGSPKGSKSLSSNAELLQQRPQYNQPETGLSSTSGFGTGTGSGFGSGYDFNAHRTQLAVPLKRSSNNAVNPNAKKPRKTTGIFEDHV